MLAKADDGSGYDIIICRGGALVSLGDTSADTIDDPLVETASCPFALPNVTLADTVFFIKPNLEMFAHNAAYRVEDLRVSIFSVNPSARAPPYIL